MLKTFSFMFFLKISYKKKSILFLFGNQGNQDFKIFFLCKLYKKIFLNKILMKKNVCISVISKSNFNCDNKIKCKIVCKF